MSKGLISEFANPGSEYRGKPFWAWNGKLDPGELRRQIRLMQRMGLGGGFMHSRVGLDTPYLSKEWFECVHAVTDECKKHNMEAWLYDEDRWPSGAAGGLVTRNPKHRMRHLVMQQLDSAKNLSWTGDVVAVFIARVRARQATDVQRVARGRKPNLAKGQSFLVFTVEPDAPSSWYNGYTYLDTMSREAVREFIRVTHEAYRKQCGRDFGKTIPGIFTDEPHYGRVMKPCGPDGRDPGIPWTGRLQTVFRKRYGYDIADHLPELFLDVEEAGPRHADVRISQARYHYLDCITHLFVDAFSRQIGEWCERHKLPHTGHVLAEETLATQTWVVGSTMRFYEYMQAPGMDILTECSREYDTAKQVSSVARQFGRKWRLTETYGCTGWDFSFAGHKAIGDWQVALGINLRCQHLSWYTMEGQAKRDYPACIFYQSPWWQMYSKVEDYFGRVHAVMTRGTEVRDILVIHPVESMWLLTRKDWGNDPAVAKLNRDFVSLRDNLLGANLDFDYGDEDILARHTRITGNKAPVFKVARASYKAVVVPPMLTIRSSTLELLERFQAAGGTVIFVGKPPAHVDALPSDRAGILAGKCARAGLRGPALAAALDPVCRRLSIADANNREIVPALYLLREDRDAFYLFVCNTGHTAAQLKPDISDVMVRDRKAAFPKVRIRGFAGCRGRPVELDPQTGEVLDADATGSGSGWEIRTSLPALGSRIFVIPKTRQILRGKPRTALRDKRRISLGRGPWEITLSESNNLVLDRPGFRIGGGAWRKPEEILRIDHKVRDALGIPHRGGRMVQPWARDRNPNPKRTRVGLRYNFGVKVIPGGDLWLALEQPQTFRITLNGTEIDTECEAGWWCDRSLRKVRLDPVLLRIGENELILDCDYSEDHPGLEIVYLLGSFGTRAQGTAVSLTAAPVKLKLGDWCRQGLTFYSGNVAYGKTVRPRLRKGERLIVRVPDYRGVAARVLVNGKPAGIVAWEPNEVDITDLLPGDGGVVKLAIEILGHRRNSHGPLHLSEKWPKWHGPGQFAGQGKDWQDTFNLVPCGLMQAPELLVRG